MASAAMGADLFSIDTWFQGAIQGLITRVQVGYAANRDSSMSYLRRHAALSGAQVQPMPGSLDVGRLRSRLEITGPAGFKKAIGIGADPQIAVRHMATNMAGVADESVRDGDRDVITQTARFGNGIVGWRRRLSGHACGFCAMLASRGAVYSDRRGATIAQKSEPYHPHCHCWAEPLYSHQQEPAGVRRLQAQWRQVTAGHDGKDAQRAWRQYWEKRQPVVREPQLLRGLEEAPAPVPAAGRVVGTGSARRIDDLPRVENPDDIHAQAMATNPRFGMAYEGQFTDEMAQAGAVGYTTNCSRTAIAYEMRRRGLDVTAGAATTKGDTVAAYLHTFRTADGKYPVRVVEDLSRSMSARDVAAEVESWPLGARGIVTLQGHTINVERDLVTGRAVFIDAQAASRKNPVMDLAGFQRRVKTRGVPTDRLMAVTRVDDLELSDYGLRYVESPELRLADGQVLKSEFPQSPHSEYSSTLDEIAQMAPDNSYRGLDLTPPGGSPGSDRTLRAAARARQAEIEARQSSANLLAEMDQLLATKQPITAMAERLQPQVLARGYGTSAVDEKLAAALKAAVESGDPAKVRAAVTAQSRRLKVTTEGGAAGKKLPWNRDTMRSVSGEDLPDGTMVSVVRRGSSVTLPSGEVVQVEPALVTRVQTPAKAAKAPVPKPQPVESYVGKDLTEIARARGLDAVPHAATEQQIDRAIADGGLELWRGVRPFPTASAQEIRDKFLHGAYEPGGGGAGSGFYSSTARSQAELYRGAHLTTDAEYRVTGWSGGAKGGLARMALPKDARIVNLADLDRELEALRQEWRAAGKLSPEAEAFLKDRGRAAAALGYDAVRLPGLTDAFHFVEPPDQILVVNRGALLAGPADDVTGRVVRVEPRAAAAKKTPAVPPRTGEPRSGRYGVKPPAAGATSGPKKATAPKAPPTPEKLSLPALKTELKTAGVPDELTAGAPKPVLARWTTAVRANGADAVQIARMQTEVADARRALAGTLTDALEFAAGNPSERALLAQAKILSGQAERALKDWPELKSLQPVLSALQSGDKAALARAVKAAARKHGLTQLGADAGKAAKFDRASMEAVGRIADGAPVTVLRPGYEATINGERVVLVRPKVVPAAEPVKKVPARLAVTDQEHNLLGTLLTGPRDLNPKPQWGKATLARMAGVRQELDRLVGRGLATESKGVYKLTPLGKRADAAAKEIRRVRSSAEAMGEPELRQLARETPTATRDLDGGAMGQTRRLDFTNGQAIVEKVYGGPYRTPEWIAHEVDAEVLGADVLRALGVRVPTVTDMGGGRLAFELIDEQPWSRVAGGRVSGVEDAIVDSAQGRLLGLGDYLIRNADRHGGNWLLDWTDRLVAIDHGEAFRPASLGHSVIDHFAKYLGGKGKLTAKLKGVDIQRIRRELEALAPRFAARGRADWYAEMMDRLDEIERRL